MQRKLSLPDARITMFRRRTLTDIVEHSDEEGKDSGGKEDTQKSGNEGDVNKNEQKTQANLPLMHQVVMEGNLEMLKELIKNGEDINVLDENGWPPLHSAIRSGNTECAAILIKEGAGEFYYNKQKQDYLRRLEGSQKGRKISYWR